MFWIRRAAALLLGGFALCAALLTSGMATASAAPVEVAKPAAVNPCGFSWGGLWGTSTYDNCSPYSVEIRIEWWSHGDTYRCVPARATVDLNSYDQTPPYYADFDGRTHC